MNIVNILNSYGPNVLGNIQVFAHNHSLFALNNLPWSLGPFS